MNEEIVPTDEKGERIKGWHPARPETGKGAVGLVFSRQAIIALLGSRHLAARPGDINRGWRLIDGGIVEAMQQAGWREYIHYPSLVQHTGMESAKTRTNHLTLVNHPHSYAASKCWMGEDFDCMTMALDKPRRVSLE